DIPIGEFIRFADIPDVRRPSALAYREGTLYVLDPETAMLKSVRIDNASVTDLATVEGLRRPTTLAVSDEGEIAITDDRIHSILRISPHGERTLTYHGGVGDTARIAYDGSKLLILDRRNGGRLFSTTPDSGGRLATGLRVGAVHDFASQRGILYFAAT